MSVPWKSATIKVRNSSVLKFLCYACSFFFFDYELNFILNVPKEVRMLTILYIWRALSQNNPPKKKKMFLMSVLKN